METEVVADVVIVEDSEECMHRLKAVVEKISGLRVVGSSTNPTEAIVLISALKPAIVILDLNLIGGSGVEVLMAIDALNIKTRVVVVTNVSSDDLVEACRSLGAQFFFDKSFEFEQFQKALGMLEAEAADEHR